LVPKELNLKEIQDLINKYGEAAWRVKEAGADGIEVHGAYGYLMSDFISLLTKKRGDAYGGELGGRMRFPMEVICTIREKVGADFPILFRISADEMVPGGRNLEETTILCHLLVEAGVNALEISRGSFEALRWVVPPMGTPIAVNTQYAAEIRKNLRVPILVVGRINDPIVAECILEEGKADLVVMSRALLVDPDLPRKALSGSYEDIVPCIACNRCLESIMAGNPVTYSMNPTVGKEKNMVIVPAREPKTVLIVGAGPAGLEAARVASLRGHRVTLYERTEKLGGQLNIASISPAKQELIKAIKYFSTQIEKSGVKVEIGKEFTPALIHQLKPDVVIIATGSTPIIPDIPGVNNPRVVTAIDVLSGKITIGNKVIIIGGGIVGSETADYLSRLSVDVTLLEMLENIATDMVI